MRKYWNEKEKKLITEAEMKKAKSKATVKAEEDAEVESEQTETPEEDAEVMMGEETPVEKPKASKSKK